MPRAGYRPRSKPTDRHAAIADRAGELRQLIRNNVVDQDAGHLTPCWQWQRYIRQDGYGEVDLVVCIGRMRVHRLSYLLFKGAIPVGLALDHLCRNPACCNPDHLEAVTVAENSRRANRHHRFRTHCKNGHPKGLGSSYASGACKRCHAVHQARWEAKNPDKVREKRRRHDARRSSKAMRV